MSINMESFEAAKNDKEVFATVFTSHGQMSINKAGYVLKSVGEYEHIVRFDLVEQANWWATKTGSASELSNEYDILDLGSWDNKGSYDQPEYEFRNDTMLLSPSDYLDDKLKVILDYDAKTMTLFFGYKVKVAGKEEEFKVEDCIVIQCSDFDCEWHYPRIGGHDIAIHLDSEDERLACIYTFSETVEHAQSEGRSHLDFLSDPVLNYAVEEKGTKAE